MEACWTASKRERERRIWRQIETKLRRSFAMKVSGEIAVVSRGTGWRNGGGCFSLKQKKQQSIFVCLFVCLGECDRTSNPSS